MIVFIALLLTCLGVFLLKEQGSYSSTNSKKVIGWLINFVALCLFVAEYGLARGAFVYLGVMAFVGMTITLFMPLDKHSVK